jgi:uncharacterized protein (DUF2236 family)
MLIGGFAALLLQTLHPQVMQGVADHSGYRKDPFGRLQRTAEFIAATTYGGEDLAASHVRHVRSVHARVVGMTEDGVPYEASDPPLLRYVHVTECFAFLRAHQRYSGTPILTSEKNRYLREMAVVAGRLGAGDVPTSTKEVRSYFHSVRPVLRRTRAAAEATEFLLTPPPDGTLFERTAHTAFCEAAVDLLPEWARHELKLWRPLPVRLGLVRPSATAVAAALRFAIGRSPVVEAAKARVGL